MSAYWSLSRSNYDIADVFILIPILELRFLLYMYSWILHKIFQNRELFDLDFQNLHTMIDDTFRHKMSTHLTCYEVINNRNLSMESTFYYKPINGLWHILKTHTTLSYKRFLYLVHVFQHLEFQPNTIIGLLAWKH